MGGRSPEGEPASGIHTPWVVEIVAWVGQVLGKSFPCPEEGGMDGQGRAGGVEFVLIHIATSLQSLRPSLSLLSTKWTYV